MEDCSEKWKSGHKERKSGEKRSGGMWREEEGKSDENRSKRVAIRRRVEELQEEEWKSGEFREWHAEE